jgi:hypothetical protein
MVCLQQHLSQLLSPELQLLVCAPACDCRAVGCPVARKDCACVPWEVDEKVLISHTPQLHRAASEGTKKSNNASEKVSKLEGVLGWCLTRAASLEGGRVTQFQSNLSLNRR